MVSKKISGYDPEQPQGHVFYRASRIEYFSARFFVFANTGLVTRFACSQFCARELPVCARVYTDRVYHHVHDYVLCCIILPYTTLKYVILVNIINNENLNRFSSLTTGKVSGLMICLETVKLMEYGIKEINRELFEIEVEHFESSILFKIVVK